MTNSMSKGTPRKQKIAKAFAAPTIPPSVAKSNLGSRDSQESSWRKDQEDEAHVLDRAEQ
jgi:hypothetical protein